VNGPLYASSQIVQDKYAFANVFKTFHGSVAAPITAPGPITAPSVPPVPTTTPTKPKYELSLSNKIFAPFCDVLLWPTFDVSKTFTVAETPWYTLAFITADTAGNAAWGSVVPTSQKFYIEELTALRTLGGDAIVSFGGAIGQELALVTLDATELQKKYQGVIDTYQFKWVDFDVEGSAITNAAANTRRAKAIAGLKKANPNLIVSLTLPVMNTGLTGEGIALIQNIVANGAVIDGMFNLFI
jgi:chitinase